VILLSQEEVQELLDLDALIEALADAHRELSAGKASMPPRIDCALSNPCCLSHAVTFIDRMP